MAVSRFLFTERARPIVQVGHGASSAASSAGARWDVSLWDDVGFADWAGVEPTWTDASTFAISADLFTGRERITDQFIPGRADIVFDNDSGWGSGDNIHVDELPIGAGLYDPTSAGLVLDEDPDGSGLYRILNDDVDLVEDPAGSGLYNIVRGDIGGGDPIDFLTTLTLGQQIRVGVDHNVYGLRWLWRGFIDDIEPVYDAENGSTVTVRALDPLGEVGRVDLASTVDETDDEGASTRVTHILNAAPWTTDKRIIDTVATGLVAAKLDGKVVDLLTRCAASVGGWVFGDTDGDVVFRSSSWLNTPASRHEDFTVTNDPAIAEPITVCASRFSRPNRRRDIAARVILGVEGLDPQPPYESTAVIDDYGAESYVVRDLWTKSTTTMADIAARILTTRSPDTIPRIDSVTINVDTDQDAAVDLATLVSVTAPSRIRCRHLDSSGVVVFDDQCFAVGVTHRITATEWVVDVALDRSDPFAIAAGPYLWDVADWDQAQWN